jgi:Flp pilus assembly protein TadD
MHFRIDCIDSRAAPSADFAVERGQAKGALYIFDDFDKLALDSPRRAKVLSRRMIALMHDDDIEAAEVSADELMALDSADPEVLTDLAHYQLDRYVHARHTR